MTFLDTDKHFMGIAIEAARVAASRGEVPVGAVLCRDCRPIAVAGNNPIGMTDPTAHAEILALREAAQLVDNYRLTGATLYVTLEPCLMCMGAIIHSRIERLVFGAFDPKTGAAASRYQIGSDGKLNHRLQIVGGVLEQQCSELLITFFNQRRKTADNGSPSAP